MAFDASGKGRRWIIVAGLFLFLAINFADKSLIGLAAGPIMRDLHLTHAAFGRIAASFYALFSVSALLVGLLANRVKTRWLLFGMAVIWSLSQAPLLLYATPATLLASRILLGASEGPAFPVAVHALYKWFPDHERMVPSALLTIGAAFGAGFIAPGITAVIAAYGWHAAFQLLAVVGLVWSAAWLRVGQEGPLGMHDGQGGQGEHATAQARPDLHALPARVPLRVLLLARTCVGCDLGGFAAYVMLTVATVWLPSYLTRVGGYSIEQVGWIVVLPAFGQMIASPALSGGSQWLMKRGISSRHARGTLGAAAVVVSGGALALMPFVPVGPLLIATVTLAFSLASFTFVTGVTLAGEIVPGAQRGGVLGINICITTLAGLITPAVMGWIIDRAADVVTGYRLGMIVAGGFSVIAGLLAAWLIHPDADRRRFIARAQAAHPALADSNRPGSQSARHTVQ
ncbi:MFS domain-containing protein [Paraburkholderia unamae]|uniref:MFS transporter n=1 Tax=Paraburkholderia unamae TaxID=219649 RepID=UPI001CB49EFA|nr:MFS transporter [Paraburkholderia unamae]CAG9274554.1 MFS domain-containing protein [Paraburkholderia unamae]